MRIEWPLTERELLIAGRSSKTYMQRTTATLVLMLPFLFTWFASDALNIRPSLDTNEALSQITIGIVTIIQFFAAYVVVANGTATAILHEREERTLELLALADPSGWDIALSKWAAALLQAVLLMVIGVPVLAMVSFLGGVNVVLVAWQTFYFTLIAASVAAIGVCASTVVNKANSAQSLTAVGVLVWIAVASIVDQTIGQGVVLGGTFFVYTRQLFMNTPPWISLPIYSLLTCVACLAFASYRIRKHVAAPPVAKPVSKKKLAKRRSPKLFNKPVEMLIAKSGAGRRTVLQVLLQVFTVVACTLLPIIGIFLLAIIISRDVARTLVSMKRDGGWDDLLVTREEDKAFASNVVRGLRRRTRLYTGTMFANLVWTWIVSQGYMGVENIFYLSVILYFFAIVPCAALDATREGTTQKRESRAGTTWAAAVFLGTMAPPMIFGLLAILSNWLIPDLNIPGWVLIQGYLFINLALPVATILWANHRFAERCANLPNVGERRADLLGTIS